MGEWDERQQVEWRTRAWSGVTPAGQRLVVEREPGGWVVRRDDSKVVRNLRLELALIEALRSDVEAHWWGIDPGRYARIVAGSILSSSNGG
jgi:hypothetical protein